MLEELLKKYAQLVVRTGVNIQPGQVLVINSPLEGAPFVRLLAETAYREGARDVVVNWKDEQLTKIRYTLAPEEVFDEFPDWQKDLYVSYARQGAAFISIAAADPELLKDIHPERVAKAQKATNRALQEYRERLMSNKNVWSVVSISTEAWAKKVFPALPPAAAVERLWQAIFHAVRVDTADPVAAWEEHKATLKRRLTFLNDKKFRLLHFQNGLGTDLTVELPPDHVWLGGSEYSAGGVEFIANMPTEEVYTVPLKTGVNGKAVSAKPLNYNGNIIDNFALTFKDGRVVEFTAEQGYPVLQKLLETDAGACYLGEVALVPFNSPIASTDILFYNTLFDENAACHLALGKGYPVCIAGGDALDEVELAWRGVNDSLIHVDFMIGTADLSITGTTADGEQIPVFHNGNFVD